MDGVRPTEPATGAWEGALRFSDRGRWQRYLAAREMAAGASVVDFACGDGSGSAVLSGVARSVVGIERSPEAVERAGRSHRRPNLRFALGSTSAIPLPDSSVDLAVSFEPLNRDSTPASLFAELKRVLRPGGRLIVSVPSPSGASGPAGRLDRDEIEKRLRAHFATTAFFELEPNGRTSACWVGVASDGGLSSEHVPENAVGGARPERVEELTALLDERESQLASALRRLHRREQQVVAMKEELRLHGVRVNKFRDEALAVSSLRGQIRVFENSRSWRFTAPLRALGRVARRVRHLLHPDGSLRLRNTGRLALNRRAGDADERLSRLFPPNQIYPMRYSAREPLLETEAAPDVRAIAFYLPQYHSNADNDLWWGKGFTDWQNVRKARPLFTNHDQPRLPAELGFYDLTVKESIERQARLIRSAGLEGVCIYYYWFQGKRLLERPLELIRDNPGIDLNYCLCWANENWTRAWDGSENEVLVRQTYSDEDDLAFIADASRHFSDPRYIRVHGKPLLLVYRLEDLPDAKKSVARWREFCLERGIGGLYVVSRSTHVAPEQLGADAGFEFPPHGLCGPAFNGVRDVHGLSPFFDGGIHDYNEMVLNSISRPPKENVFRTATMAWDNSARRYNGEPTIFINASAGRYERWLSRLCQEAQSRPPEERLVFVNAWNEWAEGAYLEPDREQGHAYVNATRRAVSARERKVPKIAVVLHLFYWDLVDELADYVSNVPFPFDLYVTATEGIYPQAFSYFNQRFPNTPIHVVEVENRARDIGPFLTKFTSRYYDYDLLCKVHSKKSPHAPSLSGWRNFLLDRLLGNETRVREIVRQFEGDPELGLLYPTYFPEVRSSITWGQNLHVMKELLSSLGIDFNPVAPCMFPAGSMFWFRPRALSTLLDFDFLIEEFPEETGQTDGTLAHAIERSFLFVVEHNEFRHQVID
jgi:lipopolysaccharide biosynthesis protein/protein-L-isoaspartate O-methyltransferase